MAWLSRVARIAGSPSVALRAVIVDSPVPVK
jgi:hypothetical protein